MQKLFGIAAFAAAAMTAPSAIGAEDCLLEVYEAVFIQGDCEVDGDRTGFTMRKGYYFAMVSPGDIGSWNGFPPESHAHNRLGVMEPYGPNCWKSDKARVCYTDDTGIVLKEGFQLNPEIIEPPEYIDPGLPLR